MSKNNTMTDACKRIILRALSGHFARPFFIIATASVVLWAGPMRGSLHASAAESSSTLGAAQLKTIFSEIILDKKNVEEGEIEITGFSANPESITVPPGIQGFRVVSHNSPKLLGKQTLVLDILINDVVQARVTLSGEVNLYGEVLCTKRGLARRTVLEPGDIERIRRNLTMLGPDLVIDETKAIGMELKTTLQPGAVLYSHFLKNPETVKRGDIVTILAENGTLTITVPGRVLTAGATGETIKVKNLQSRREVVARVIGPDTVQVDL